MNQTFTDKCNRVGLDPLLAIGVCAMDIMLFGANGITLGAGWIVTGPIGLALAIPATLIQKYSYNDNWGAALGKGMLVGLVTATPTPIPAAITLTLGGAGFIGAPSKDK